MTYLLLTLFYRIWFLVSGILILTTISRSVFGRQIKNIPSDLVFVLLWPLMIFSKDGRKQFKRKMKELK